MSTIKKKTSRRHPVFFSITFFLFYYLFLSYAAVTMENPMLPLSQIPKTMYVAIKENPFMFFEQTTIGTLFWTGFLAFLFSIFLSFLISLYEEFVFDEPEQKTEEIQKLIQNTQKIKTTTQVSAQKPKIKPLSKDMFQKKE